MSGLNVVNRLIGELHAEGIIYCHWKSNEHIEEAMVGLTDLDILVEKGVSLKLDHILSKTGFKRFTATPSRTYPAIEDYLALDFETGKLVHLHLHYELTIGEKHLKGYRLPWESLILSTRQLNTKQNIYVTDPNVEMLLLIVRAALKIRTRNYIFALFGKTYFEEDMLVEFNWLKKQIQMERVVDIVKDLLGEETVQLLLEMLSNKPSFRQLLSFRRCTKRNLRLYKTYGPLEAVLLRWLRELRWLLGVVNKRYLHRPIPYRRTIPHGGVLVAFVGADGSGKSTLVEKIVNWFSWKADVFPIYFGSGDGPSSPARWSLQVIHNLMLRVGALGRKDTGDKADEKYEYAEGEKSIGWLKTVAKVFWALILAYEKRGKLCQARRAENLGMLVICDRFPQSQVMGFNDGPLLSHWLDHRWGLLRTIAHWEFDTYKRFEKCPPDLIIKLHITPEVASRRKQNMHIEDIRRRVEAVKSLQYPPETRIVDVNADESLDQVILGVKQAVWERI